MSFYSLIYRHDVRSVTQRNYFEIRLETQINSNKNIQIVVVSWKRKWFHIYFFQLQFGLLLCPI